MVGAKHKLLSDKPASGSLKLHLSKSFCSTTSLGLSKAGAKQVLLFNKPAPGSLKLELRRELLFNWPASGSLKLELSRSSCPTN
jgi:hypothetical protein